MTRYLVVIGAQRSATTYLYEVLDDHPQIVMARPSRPEPKFFLDPQRYAGGLQAYEATYFAAATQEVHGEKSTSYLEVPEVASRIAAVLPDPQILVLLRDPIARAVSNWRFSAGSGLEVRPLAQALTENMEGPLDWDPSLTSVSPFAYLERGRYSAFLRPWLEQFADRLVVLFTEEFVGDVASVARLYRTVGVDADHQAAPLHNAVNTSRTPAERVPADLLAALRRWFADSDAELRALLHRGLPWDAPVRGAAPMASKSHR